MDAFRIDLDDSKLLGSGSAAAMIGWTVGSASYTIASAAPVREGQDAVFTVTRTDATDSATISYSLGGPDDTADDSDYSDTQDGMVTFESGSLTATITVHANTDTLSEPTETFSVVLNVSNDDLPVEYAAFKPFGMVAGPSATGTILDTGTALFSIADTSTVEGQAAVFTVNRTGDLSASTDVTFTVTSGTATFPDDYTVMSGTVHFDANSATATISIPTVDDTIAEPDETFTVTLNVPIDNNTATTTATSGLPITNLIAVPPGPPEKTSAQGTIVDNDGTGTISITGDTVTEGGELTFVVSRAPLAPGGILTSGSVTILDQMGSAIDGSSSLTTSDYDFASATSSSGSSNGSASFTLNFAAGQVSATITVPTFANTDPTDSGIEDFVLTVDTATASATTDGQSATGVILDQSASTTASTSFTYAITGGTAVEGQPLVFEVSRSGNTQSASSILVYEDGGSADLGSDYNFDPASDGEGGIVVNFAAGQTSATVTLTTIQDNDPNEGAETVDLTLENVQGGEVTFLVGSATGVILDGPVPVVVTPPDNGGGGGGGGGGTAPFQFTNNADLYSGSDDPEKLQALDGNDSVSGAGGDDTIAGMMGNDSLTGGQGNDTVYGGQGDDKVFGNDGDDRLFGNIGSDSVTGNMGNDTVSGNQGLDLLFGGQGNDRIYGGQDADTIYGNLGDDLISGNMGNDSVFGGQGNDTLYGGQGSDTLVGGLGNDLLFGNLGADQFNFANNSGNDEIRGFSQAEGDRIHLLDGQTYTVGNQNGSAVLTLSGGGTVTLTGVQASAVNGGFFA